MKKSHIIIVILVLILAGIFTYKGNKVAVDTNNNTPIVTQEESVVGCYAMRGEQDVYTLRINSKQDNNVTGTLAFKNFQKDSSSGSFVGSYNNGILVGDYSFASEGMDSVMQVAFKKSGDSFIRGYGDVDDATGTRFVDVTSVVYDSSLPLSIFKSEPCV